MVVVQVKEIPTEVTVLETEGGKETAKGLPVREMNVVVIPVAEDKGGNV